MTASCTLCGGDGHSARYCRWRNTDAAASMVFSAGRRARRFRWGRLAFEWGRWCFYTDGVYADAWWEWDNP